MLTFSKKTGYGLIALSYLARLQAGQVASARDVAEKFSIPAFLLMNVLKDLAAAGYVCSTRGAHGGYRLARRPEEIDLQQVISALDGPIGLAECLQQSPKAHGESCKLMDRCPIIDPVHRIQRKLKEFLKAVTLADIAQPMAADVED